MEGELRDSQFQKAQQNGARMALDQHCASCASPSYCSGGYAACVQKSTPNCCGKIRALQKIRNVFCPAESCPYETPMDIWRQWRPLV